MPSDSDLTKASYLIRVLGRTSPVLILLLLTGLPAYAVVLLWLLFALLVSLAAGRLGCAFVNLLHGTCQRELCPTSTCAADLDKARLHKREKRYPEALRLVNCILDQHPQQLAALLLKAELLWEGFANRDAALSCLDRLLTSPAVDEKYRNWARQLQQEFRATPAPKTHTPDKA